jgi:hypothetical protein
MRSESLGTIEDFREITTMRMNYKNHPVSPTTWRTRLLGMFNLNDGRWGRDKDGNPTFDPNGSQPIPPSSEEKKPQDEPRRPAPGVGAGGPPDLDELWRDFNAKISGGEAWPLRGCFQRSPFRNKNKFLIPNDAKKQI